MTDLLYFMVGGVDLDRKGGIAFFDLCMPLIPSRPR